MAATEAMCWLNGEATGVLVSASAYQRKHPDSLLVTLARAMTAPSGPLLPLLEDTKHVTKTRPAKMVVLPWQCPSKAIPFQI